MVLNKIKIMLKLSKIEFSYLVRSTKIIILALFIIFINIQIITPLRECGTLMESKLSIFEPFAALGNSGVVVLILPLFFITMMADYPREGNNQYFYHVRCGKRVWLGGQILYAVASSMALALFVFACSVILSLDFVECNSNYSYAVTRYVATFPERAGEYVVQLIPENLYNQISLLGAIVNTMLLTMLYFMMLALIILIFTLMNRKIVGLLLDGTIVTAGAILCSVRATYMWVLPMAHTITWLHYSEYVGKPVLPLGYSYLYFGVINLVLIVISVVMSKRYNIM